VLSQGTMMALIVIISYNSLRGTWTLIIIVQSVLINIIVLFKKIDKCHCH
jgi:hypothetical protein